MNNRTLALILGVAGLLLIAFSAFQLRTASQDLKAHFPSVLSAYIDEGSAQGAIELTLEPKLDIPDQVTPKNPFSMSIKMELVKATFGSGSELDEDHMSRVRSEILDEMKLRLNLAGAEVVPKDWQSIGSDLTYHWSVSLPNAGTHEGNIEKRIEFNGDVVARSADQVPFSIAAGSQMDAWKSAWGHMVAIFGLMMTIGSFYFAWRKHLREERNG